MGIAEGLWFMWFVLLLFINCVIWKNKSIDQSWSFVNREYFPRWNRHSTVELKLHTANTWHRECTWEGHRSNDADSTTQHRNKQAKVQFAWLQIIQVAWAWERAFLCEDCFDNEARWPYSNLQRTTMNSLKIPYAKRHAEMPVVCCEARIMQPKLTITPISTYKYQTTSNTSTAIP